MTGSPSVKENLALVGIKIKKNEIEENQFQILKVKRKTFIYIFVKKKVLFCS